MADGRAGIDPAIFAGGQQDAPLVRFAVAARLGTRDGLGHLPRVVRMDDRPDPAGFVEGQFPADDGDELRRTPEGAMLEIGLEHARPRGMHGEFQPLGVGLRLLADLGLLGDVVAQAIDGMEPVRPWRGAVGDMEPQPLAMAIGDPDVVAPRPAVAHGAGQGALDVGGVIRMQVRQHGVQASDRSGRPAGRGGKLQRAGHRVQRESGQAGGHGKHPPDTIGLVHGLFPHDLIGDVVQDGRLPPIAQVPGETAHPAPVALRRTQPAQGPGAERKMAIIRMGQVVETEVLEGRGGPAQQGLPGAVRVEDAPFMVDHEVQVGAVLEQPRRRARILPCLVAGRAAGRSCNAHRASLVRRPEQPVRSVRPALRQNGAVAWRPADHGGRKGCRLFLCPARQRTLHASQEASP